MSLPFILFCLGEPFLGVADFESTLCYSYLKLDVEEACEIIFGVRI